MVRRLVRLWLAVVIGGGLAPMPIAGAGATTVVRRAAPPALAALPSNRPADAARVARADLRLDAGLRSQHKAVDPGARHDVRGLAYAGRASVLCHSGGVDLGTASPFTLRGPPLSA